MIKTKVENIIDNGKLPVETTLAEPIHTGVSVNDIQEKTKNGRIGIYISLLGEVSESKVDGLVVHWAFVCQEHGLENWEITSKSNQTCDQTGELIQQEGILFSVVADALREIGVDPRNPRDPPMSPFVTFEELGVDSED